MPSSRTRLVALASALAVELPLAGVSSADGAPAKTTTVEHGRAIVRFEDVPRLDQVRGPPRRADRAARHRVDRPLPRRLLLQRPGPRQLPAGRLRRGRPHHLHRRPGRRGGATTTTDPVAGSGTALATADLPRKAKGGTYTFDVVGDYAVSDPDTVDSDSLLGRFVTLHVAQTR